MRRTPSPAQDKRAPRLPAHLPVVEETLDPEAVQACPAAWRCIGQEINETLDYEPARFFRRRLIRRKFVARHGGADATPIIAPLPAGLLERGLPTAGLLAQVLVAKYADHLPLYRQEAIYRQRHGVHLPRQTLARWVEVAAGWLRPVYEAMRREVFAGNYVQVDETPIRCLCPGLGRTAQGYLWTYARPGGDVCFDWQTGRSARCLEGVIPAGFAGALSSATATRPTRPSCGAGRRGLVGSPWRAAGPMCGASFTRPESSCRARWPGSWARSASSTASSANYAEPAPARGCARRSAPPRADPSRSGCTAPSCV